MQIIRSKDETKIIMDGLYLKYANPGFIENDPIQIPHRFSKKEDIEIAAILTATISWGNRKSIVQSADRLLKVMGKSPFEFVSNFSHSDIKSLDSFVHRTFNSSDCTNYIKVLNKICQHENGLENIFLEGYRREGSIKSAIVNYRETFIKYSTNHHTLKHIPDLDKNSAGKRINMFLRWMVRPSSEGIDFGLWEGMPKSALMIPLDVHSSKIARQLGLINRKQNDWKTVEALTKVLREFDRDDPTKYDFALFGLGVNNDFNFSI